MGYKMNANGKDFVLGVIYTQPNCSDSVIKKFGNQ